MEVVKWPQLYCWVPLKYKKKVQTSGIDWCCIRLYTSKDLVEEEVRGRFNILLLTIDTSKICHSKVIVKDFHNWYYKGSVPSEAMTVIREKGENYGKKRRSASVFQRGRLI